MRATVRDFAAGDSIDLQHFARAGETLHYTSDGDDGVLRVQSGGHVASLYLVGSYDISHFHLGDDAHGGTYLTYDGHDAALAGSFGG